MGDELDGKETGERESKRATKRGRESNEKLTQTNDHQLEQCDPSRLMDGLSRRASGCMAIGL